MPSYGNIGSSSITPRKSSNRMLKLFSRLRSHEPIPSGTFIDSDLRSNANLNFKIFVASGGYVLEFYRYDIKHDETYTKMYVISDTEELSESIALICKQEFFQL